MKITSLKVVLLSTGLSLLTLSSCTSEKEQRIEEIKTELKSIGKDIDEKTRELSNNSESTIQTIEHIQRMKAISEDADTKEDEAELKKMEEKNKKLDTELKELMKKSDALIAEHKKLKSK